ncbi:MAG: 23S rRNA (guanosine(2251)-2'-O)-methyltransferase RlmB [Nitrosomonadaceae bacterium]|nr:23S rRNA (guanosine(2251)-2'-O)-methyltransferase RlmB [Nitrosomonadaceae bacterium]|tara:strand:- start:174 stop:920 length:747 start_codon:yes stop_codon:yes gene_type:complete
MSNTRLIFGFHAITSRLRQNPKSVKEIFLDSSRRDQRARDLIKLTETQKIQLILCDGARLSTMLGGTSHQGVVANIDTTCNHIDIEEVLANLTEPALFLILDGIQDPHNLGACLRVADAFGVTAVISPKDRSVGLTATVYKVASGAADSVPYIVVTNLARTLRKLKENGIWIIGTNSGVENKLPSLKIDGSVAWVLGAEGRGMRRLTRETCDQLISIPMLGGVESLNVSVSAGICLFETYRQRTNNEG